MFEELDFDVVDDELQRPFRHARNGIRADPELISQVRGPKVGRREEVKIYGKAVSQPKGEGGAAGEGETGGGRFLLQCQEDFEEVQGNGGALEHRKAEAGRSNQTRQNAKARGWSARMPVTMPARRLLP